MKVPGFTDDNQSGISLRAFISRLVCLCVGPLVLLAAYLAFDSVRTTQSTTDIEATNLAKNFATAIDHNLGARIGALQMLATSPLVDDPTLWKDLYQEGLGFYQSFSSHVIFADPNMHMLFNTRMPFGSVLPMLPHPEGHSAVTRVLDTGTPAVGDVFIGPISKHPLIALAVPTIRNKKVVRIFVSIFETMQFQERLEQVALPSEWSLALLDGKNDVIAGSKLFNPHRNGDSDVSRIFTAKSDLSPWLVVLEIPRKTYRAPLFSAIIALSIGIIFATLIGVFGAILTSRRLAKAVTLLVSAPLTDSELPDIIEIATALRQRVATDAARLEIEQRFRATFEQAAVGIAHVAPDGSWLRVNQKLCDIVDYNHDELIEKTFQDITHPNDLDLDLSYVEQMLTGEIATYSMDKRYLRKNGEIIWINLTVALVRQSTGAPEYFISVIEDINRRKQAEDEVLKLNAELEMRVAERTAELSAANQKLAIISISDGLTGLANRRHLDDVLNAEWRRAARQRTPLALLLLDVDFFKLYNDYYGHQAGDECLKQVAAVLERHARRAGELAARYGGEEFVIILPGVGIDYVESRAEEVRREVAALTIPHTASKLNIVTVSIGIACMVPGGSKELSRLIAEADKALYQAKETGRNRGVAMECGPLRCSDYAVCRPILLVD